MSLAFSVYLGMVKVRVLAPLGRENRSLALLGMTRLPVWIFGAKPQHLGMSDNRKGGGNPPALQR